jgi:uncharacterized protein (TIGR00725 family)
MFVYNQAMNRRPVIAVVGSGKDLEPAISNARQVGRLVAENGWVLITGGRDSGVMRAANDGAKVVDGSLTIGILPNREAGISPSVDVAIISDTGESRNNIIVLSADIVIACGVDGAGTASEVALAIKNGKPVVLFDANDTAREFFAGIGGSLIHTASSPADTIKKARELL